MVMGAPMMSSDEEFSAPQASFYALTADRRSVPPAQPLMQRARPPVRPLDSLVALQRADGSWKLTAELARILGWPDLRRLLQAFGRPLAGPPEERAAATALALAWLERVCADALDEWRMLATKAREWLDRTPEGADAWLQLADAALAKR
jgi:hypothetical protein